MPDILSFDVSPVTDKFKGLTVTFNQDAFTPEYYYNVAKLIRETAPRIAERKANYDEAVKNEKDVTVSAALSFENSAKRLEEEREVYAILLAGNDDTPVLMSWNATRKVKDEKSGKMVEQPVPCTKDELMKRSPQFLKELYNWCQENHGPKSQETPMTPGNSTISETTAGG